MTFSRAADARLTTWLCAGLLLVSAGCSTAAMDPGDGLPLVSRPAAHPAGDAFAVFLSGDGGWRPVDIHVTDVLNQRGISVVGLLTNQYYGVRRTPEQGAADLERVIADYGTRWQKRRVLLIGFSRGADVLPFLITRLSPEIRSRIDAVALLGLEPTIDFRYHPSWIPFYHPHETQYQVLPELTKLRGMHLLCVHGEREKDSLCPLLPPGMAEDLRMKGGHHFGGRYADVAEAILRVERAGQSRE